MTQQTDANDVLMGAAGAPAAKFENPGTTWEGQIVSPPQSHQVRKYDPKNPGAGELRFFPSGDPIMGVTVVIQTTDRDMAIDNDDGTRTIYLDGQYNKEAVRNAVKASGAKGLEVGGYLKVTFTHREDPTDKQSRKYWDVLYTPAGNAALMNDGTSSKVGDDPLPTGANAPAHTPQQQDTAKQLLGIPGLTDNQIAMASGLTLAAVATLRAQTNDPPF